MAAVWVGSGFAKGRREEERRALLLGVCCVTCITGGDLRCDPEDEIGIPAGAEEEGGSPSSPSLSDIFEREGGGRSHIRVFRLKEGERETKTSLPPFFLGREGDPVHCNALFLSSSLAHSRSRSSA